MEIDSLEDRLLDNGIVKSNIFKDKSIEKGSIDMIEQDKKKDLKERDIYDPNEGKQFDYDTLNRDLADIEERLRQTRLSWSKNSGTPTHEYSDMFVPTQGVRKSWSLLDIERRNYSSASSNGELEKIDGEKHVCESPALSEGILKWDYGADIGIEQDDSEDMEPITWPVTAEEAQRNEKDAMNRRMKQSLSQGSFIASPDPEDKHNLISAMSMEYKSKRRALSQNHINHRHYNSVSTLSVGKFDDVSARQIMEQAEAAEKRLRERLETVKAIHLSGKVISKEAVTVDDKPPLNEQECLSKTQSGRHIFDQSSQHDKKDFVARSTKTLQNQVAEEFIPETNKSNAAAEDGSGSPTSISNTGRTTTIESTHSFSDYAKAPIFQPETYGTRTDYPSFDNCGSMYARRNKEKPVDRGRTVCGIAPELDTISSRETLHFTDEKKELSLTSACSRHDDVSALHRSLKENPTKEVFDKIKNNRCQDAPSEHSLQAKWDRFKALRKDDDLDDQLFEKTNVRSATQFNPQNSHRQYSSSNTFTTITNVSPRYDSFATETFKSPLRGHIHRDIVADNYDSAGDKVKKSSDKMLPIDDKKKSDHQRSRSNQCLNTRSGPGRRIVSGSGGGKDEDDDDDISQTEKRRIRHSGHLRKLKKKFGSGQLDGETTASELEHDDAAKYLQNSNGKGGRCKQLSQMLTKLSRRGVAEETAMDMSSGSNSTSVDTMQLMDRMSSLLRKQKDVSRKNGSHDRTTRKHLTESMKRANNQAPERTIPPKLIETEDGMLVLKHLMLKQKVKWLADCAREEARRRKVKKLQRLIDMYEQGDHVLVPSDLETDTATLMGSDMGSQNELDSQSDSYSQYDEVTPVELKPQPRHSQEKSKKCRVESSANRQSGEKKQSAEHPSVKERKSYPVSEAWHIPLREGNTNRQEGANESNWHDGSSPTRRGRPAQRYRSPCSRAESSRQEKTPNLSVKERVRMKYEFEMARQRNAHECQKDIRHTKTGNTKVAAGGLSWSVGQDCGNGKSMFHSDENFKEKGDMKSELQLAFENRMEEFISRSRQRQKRIKLASDDRRYESQMNIERARLFVNSGPVAGIPRRRPVTKPDPLSARSGEASSTMMRQGSACSNVDRRPTRRSKSENLYRPRRRKVSKTEMKMQSARKYQALPEVQAKYMDERKKAKIQNNRMRMQHYGERVLQSVLRNRAPWVSESR